MIQYALTFRQPWLWVMQHKGKRVENRSWLPTQVARPTDTHSEPFALHAGGQFDVPGWGNLVDGGLPWPVILEDPRLPHPKDFQMSAIVAVARVVYPIWKANPDGPVTVAANCPGHNYGTPIPYESIREQYPWFCGPYGWPLEIQWLKQPIGNVRGARRFWRVPSFLREIIRERLEGNHGEDAP